MIAACPSTIIMLAPPGPLALLCRFVSPIVLLPAYQAAAPPSAHTALLCNARYSTANISPPHNRLATLPAILLLVLYENICRGLTPVFSEALTLVFPSPGLASDSDWIYTFGRFTIVFLRRFFRSVGFRSLSIPNDIAPSIPRYLHRYLGTLRQCDDQI
jgi:hypothetical protein